MANWVEKSRRGLRPGSYFRWIRISRRTPGTSFSSATSRRRWLSTWPRASAKPACRSRRVRASERFEQPGLVEKAVEYWYQAGRRASERAALAEAISHFGKALDLLGSFREPSARMQREIDLQIALGGALIAAKGYAAPRNHRQSTPRPITAGAFAFALPASQNSPRSPQVLSERFVKNARIRLGLPALDPGCLQCRTSPTSTTLSESLVGTKCEQALLISGP
jgi:hypothetical protein